MSKGEQLWLVMEGGYIGVEKMGVQRRAVIDLGYGRRVRGGKGGWPLAKGGFGVSCVRRVPKEHFGYDM